MRRFLRENSLSLFFLAIFLLSLLGTFYSGWSQFNADQHANGLGQMSLLQYLTSADFAADVTENWQSEFLQFLLYIAATVWFLQKGSPESKPLDRPGLETDQEQKVGRSAERESPTWARTGGLRTFVFSWSLTSLMALIFFGSWLTQYIAGRAAYNETRLEQLQNPMGWWTYATSGDFWSRSLQNWQSEFLAVGSMAVFSIFLRQRGSPESKPVGEAPSTTGG